MALPTCQCVANLPPWKQLAPIIAATREWAGLPVEDRCYEGRPISQQLEQWYCALYEIAQNGPNPPPDVPVMLMDMVIAPSTSDAPEGTVVSAALMTSATKGTNPGTWGVIGFGGPTNLTYTTLGPKFDETPEFALSDGTNTYTGSEDDALTIDFDCENPTPPNPADPQNTWEGVRNSISTPMSDVVLVARFRTASGPDPTQTVSINHDWIELAGDRDLFIAQQVQEENGLTNYLHAHRTGDTGNNIVLNTSTVYEVWMFYNDTDAYGEIVFLSNSVPVGSTETNFTGPSGVVSRLDLKDYLFNRAGFARIGPVGMKWISSTWPPRAFTVPTPVSVVAAQTNISEVTLTIVSVATRLDIDEEENGGGYTPIETNYYLKSTTTTKTYVLSGLNDGSTYTWGVRNVMCGQDSATVESNGVTIDNSGFGGDWATGLTSAGSASSAVGERGVKITVGTNPVTVTELAAWFTAGTYDDVAVTIYSESAGSPDAVLGTVTVPHAGSTVGADNWVALGVPVNLSANTVYFILRDVTNFNEYPFGGSITVNSSIAAFTAPSDENGADPGAGGNGYGVNFRF